MRKKISTRLICLILSGIMLTGALTVAAINGSPYETLKNAMFNAMTYDSFRMEGRAILKIDGVIEEYDTISFVISENGSLEIEENRFSLIYNDTRITWAYNDEGTQWYSARIDRWGSFAPWPAITQEERNSAQGQFIELFIDIIVGDLVNNMYMTSNDGVRQISGQITHNQLPELMRLGIQVLIEQSRARYNGDYGTRADFANAHPMDVPIRSLNFERISGEAEVDARGNLLSLEGYVEAEIETVFGDTKRVEVILEMRFLDIGAASIDHPLVAAAELLTADYMEDEFGRRYVTLYFTRNADGTMNRESLTDIWPGNLARERERIEYEAARTERLEQVREAVQENARAHECQHGYYCQRFLTYVMMAEALLEEGFHSAAWDARSATFDMDLSRLCLYTLDYSIKVHEIFGSNADELVRGDGCIDSDYCERIMEYFEQVRILFAAGMDDEAWDLYFEAFDRYISSTQGCEYIFDRFVFMDF